MKTCILGRTRRGGRKKREKGCHACLFLLACLEPSRTLLLDRHAPLIHPPTHPSIHPSIHPSFPAHLFERCADALGPALLPYRFPLGQFITSVNRCLPASFRFFDRPVDPSLSISSSYHRPPKQEKGQEAWRHRLGADGCARSACQEKASDGEREREKRKKKG